MSMKGLIAALAVLVSTALSQEAIYLTVGYCTDPFTGAGAIVKVNPTTGNYTIVQRFKWPSELFGCVINYDPTVYFDRTSGNLYLDFTDDFGYLITLNVPHGRIVSTAKPSDIFFTGFENMQYASGHLLGLAAHVTQSGYCSQGCFQICTMAPVTGIYHFISDVPFRALMDDTHFYDNQTQTYWVQASYPLTSQRCSPHDTELCLLEVNGASGQLKSVKQMRPDPDLVIYKYSPWINPDGSMLAFVEGFADTCQHPYNNFAFAQVNLPQATAKLGVCVSRNTTIHMDEWISSFNADETLFATGSGDTEARGQLLVFNTATGAAVVNTELSGLGPELKSWMNLFVVWSVDFY